MGSRRVGASSGEGGGPRTSKNRYMSPSIAARRARILSTARAMILESGLQFAIRDLADRAEVAFGSIYYLFGSKEELVAYVLEDFIHELRSTRAADRAVDPLSIDI